MYMFILILNLKFQQHNLYKEWRFPLDINLATNDSANTPKVGWVNESKIGYFRIAKEMNFPPLGALYATTRRRENSSENLICLLFKDCLNTSIHWTNVMKGFLKNAFHKKKVISLARRIPTTNRKISQDIILTLFDCKWFRSRHAARWCHPHTIIWMPQSLWRAIHLWKKGDPFGGICLSLLDYLQFDRSCANFREAWG